MKAVSDSSVERYLLGEMSAVEAEEFERHYFECQECAIAVESGEVLVANAREVLAEIEPDARKEYEADTPRQSWWGSLMAWRTNPAFVFTSAATLVLGALSLYQGAVEIPRLRHNLNDARILPAFQLIGASRGAESQITVPLGTLSFSVSADIPPDVHFPGYVCSLSVDGRILFNVLAPAPAVGQPVTILVPAKGLAPGTYELGIYGADADGHKRDRVSTFAFVLKFG